MKRILQIIMNTSAGLLIIGWFFMVLEPYTLQKQKLTITHRQIIICDNDTTFYVKFKELSGKQIVPKSTYNKVFVQDTVNTWVMQQRFFKDIDKLEFIITE